MRPKSGFGKKLFEYQCDQRMTGKEFAAKLGISSDKLSRYKHQEPHATTVHDIAKKLDLPVSYFTED